ncbi:MULTISPECIES: translesion error-prone DNA polymerase V autoproteolytic subunit [Pseudoalteromonas]|jgi:DNA polymerase V|uniref:DNA polymerase V subunit UmuD n=3 Tax=Pseudoalteromonas TaxID=53246 RepID=A0A6G6AQT2_PSET1|nr:MULTISPECIES: translesion error-prone DNA polymerase V autoproteolytic subunit [Pseudoalteromonas]KPZ59269.1 LexA repressor [Pseudoalteromonas sp. P1-13-1a]MBB1282725.1 translesion error-prone DNA polymerase V autoproteolytic subunit [Pseudoalteromonas sp. SR41-1]MBW4966264.1 translesion error-prone DNA polymerase V autoproteolytic subunit [Pseudoalteromonas sp. CR1]NMP04654.1 translesion error-prone DNA polymerase V autoproteolytic subunit [Pseudoalteromonas arctica]QID24524.1 DNA polymera|tara:strand:- start:7567 stop:7983 length:417 start_codon:yes stop_codon:yes gene_type:complete
MFVIPIFIEAGITGFESPAAEYVELGISIDELIIKHPNATFIGIASGQSMQEVGIFDGDLLVIDRAEDVSTGDIIVASYNGSFVCKIIDKSKRLLISASKDYKSVYISNDDDFKLEGVVTASIRLHRNKAEVNRCLPS